MTHRQRIFITEYIKSGNATDSAKKAGYSERSAYSVGQRMLKNVEIKEEIEKIQKEALEKAEITITEVLNLITDIARNGKSENNKLKAMDMLMKYFGAYSDDMKLISKMNDFEIGKLADKLMNKLNDDE